MLRYIYFEWKNGLSARSIFPRAVKHLWEKYGAPVKCEVQFAAAEGKN
ncbi:MAG: hypothetical protein AB1611_13955 [bacterium]